MMVKVICSDCNVVMGKKDMGKNGMGNTPTHSLCSTCADKKLKEIRDKRGKNGIVR